MIFNSDTNSVYTLLKASEEFLSLKNLLTPKFDSELLLSYVLQIKQTRLPLVRNQKLTNNQILRYEKCILRRSKREPIAYITGFKGFMNFEFKVNKSVLIPRPETELLVEIALELAKNENKESVLDLCTGSGCIAISLAKLRKFKNIVASDINSNALKVAKKNSQINNVFNIKFVKSDMFDNINGERFDIIISNPPYVSKEEYDLLESELKYEPKLALIAQDDGMFFYKEISSKALNYLNNDGFILLELNANKFHEIRHIFLSNSKYKNVEIMNDYSGLSRILKTKINR
ncbi:MAG: peptide chain release factor N(5)-glutamine methyltransferase [Endomicrobium sp.]|jgi:release factor glutamine methyltransferase|nr:peptide chain release factor N(5)-glutamine methyltransferase [Endomicrobium sp.]